MVIRLQDLNPFFVLLHDSLFLLLLFAAVMIPCLGGREGEGD